jgi:hypothetical protein
MVFIGLRAILVEENNTGASFKNAGVLHFNPHYIKLVNEKKMVLVMDDGSTYRIDDESMTIFLSACYGEDEIRGDKLRDEKKNGGLRG